MPTCSKVSLKWFNSLGNNHLLGAEIFQISDNKIPHDDGVCLWLEILGFSEKLSA